jgi:hypothetical protein
MSLDAIVVQGTLKPDGSLELNTKPVLAPGRVYITLQQGAAAMRIATGGQQ